MTDRLSPQREAEIRKHVAELIYATYGQRDTERTLAIADAVMPAVRAGYAAELAAVRAERDQARRELAKYVGAEPTVAEEMEYLSGCLDAVRDLCDATEKQATRWENPLPVPDWVEQVRAATDGVRPDDPNDRRRRIYLDGKGRAWIDDGVDSGGLCWIAPIDDSVMEATREAVTAETGSLREIGRCW